MNFLICDDNLYSIQELKELLLQTEEDITIKSFTNIPAMEEYLDANDAKADCIFMDIELRGDGEVVLGTQEIKNIAEKYPLIKIVYVTGYPRKYVQSIFDGAQPAGFLIKPVQKEYLEKTISRLKAIMKEESEVLTIHRRNMTTPVPFRQIIYINSSAHNIIIHTEKEDFTIYEKLSHIESILPDSFSKCHKSYIVNLDMIDKINSWSEIVMSSGNIVPISRSYREAFKDKLISRSAALI